MKARVVDQYVARLVPELEGMEEESFRSFLNWRGVPAELDKRVISPFKEALYGATGFSDQNRPSDERAIAVPAGKLVFTVTTKPTTKRPCYREVVEGFGGYLDVLHDQFAREIRRKEVVTIEGHPYVSTEDLCTSISSALKAHLDGKDGISQSVELPGGFDVPDELAIPVGRRYGELTDYNARLFVKAVGLKEAGNARANAFKKAVLEDSLAAVPDPNETVLVVSYAFDGFDVVHQIERRKTPKYGDVVDAFVAPAPQKLTSRSKIGDLVKAELYCLDDAFRSYAEEKGLADSEFLGEYAPRRREDLVYVRLEGTRGRLAKYREEKVTPGIEQNFAAVLK